jgi:MHS family proline/betaine transporter-like MFS transporter
MMLMIMIVIIPVGALSDRVGRKPLILASCVGFIVLGYPSFALLAMGTVLGTVAGLVVLGLLLVLLLGTMSATLPALFATDVRYGGFSIGYTLSTSIFGGTAPFVLETLVIGTGDNAMPGIYLVVASLVSPAAVITVTESARKPLPGPSASVLRPRPA